MLIIFRSFPLMMRNQSRLWYQRLQKSLFVFFLVILGAGHASAQGEVDPDFSVGTVSSTVRAITTQADGKILVGGQFTSFGGVSRSRIVRLHSNGTVDLGFNPAANGFVSTIAVQPDGKILLGGLFTTIDDVPRLRLARLHADGSLDLSFAPDVSHSVEAIALQPDGGILVGGVFSSISGQTRQRIARLHTDGSLDMSFDPNADNTVNTIAVQDDGKILLGGAFSSVGGASRRCIARIHPDGSADSEFDPGTYGFNIAHGDTVNTIAIQPDGKILAGGIFTKMGGVTRNRIARINFNGTVDEDFDPDSSAAIHTFALQADGKILVGGEFSQIAGSVRANIARLNADGTADDTFDPGANNTVLAITLGDDGKPFVGGSFSVIGGENRPCIARLLNDPATSGFAADGTEKITWMRGGSAPEIGNVSFDYWDGISWVAAEPVERIAGGWQVEGLTLPTSTWLRARGLAAGGRHNASTRWIVEIIHHGGAAFPQIDVSVGGEPLDYGNAVVTFAPHLRGETSEPLTLTIHNAGDAPLAGLSASIQGFHAQEFSMSGLSEDPLPPGGQVTFDVFFSPVGGGLRQAELWIASNDGARSPFVVRLDGAGVQRDDGFSASATATVRAIATQADGKIVVGGEFNQAFRGRIARIHPNGEYDAAFRVAADNTIHTLAIQLDGKILIGGLFTSVNGASRSHIARLNADGTLDASFNPGAGNTVIAIALEPDGGILVGGQFTTIAGQSRQRIARLHPDGSLDTEFNPDTGSSYVNALAIQPDGKILMGGYYQMAGGSGLQRFARLHPDGSIDDGFNAGANSTVNTVSIQPDGKILVGGFFSTLGGVPRERIARLHADGMIDESFNPGSSGVINTFALQADGKILVGGEFTRIAGSLRSYIARLNADGTADSTFDPGANDSVMAITLDVDGKPLVGGAFTNLGGASPNRLARLLNDPATSNLSANGTEQITWMRGGSSPEFEKVTLDYWNGLSWMDAGLVERIPGGWQASGLSLPASAWIRASGVVTSGRYSGSTGRIEKIISYGGGPFPQIEVSLAGEPLDFANAAISFESQPWGETSAPITITIHNTGDAPLAGLSVAIGGIHMQEFSAGGLPEDSLPPGGQVECEVFFSPLGGGPRQAELWIASSDGSRSPFVVRLHGTGVQLDDEFGASANSTVHAIGTQVDGRIVVGGQFTSISGVPRSRIARLRPDGTIDMAFDAEVDGSVNTLAIQPDGKILFGGQFNSVNGTSRMHIARLNADGSLDTSFSPDAASTVNAIVVLPDGGILVGGQFNTFAGQSRLRIARLHPDGSLDMSFNPGAGNTVNTIAVQHDGKILLGGSFTSAGGSTRQRIARLHPDGSLDTEFNPGASGTVNTITVQPDGNILVGGLFTTISGAERQRIARLHPDGSADETFNPGCLGAVNSFALQADGKILVGGQFSHIAGSVRENIARLHANGTVDDTFDPGASITVFAITLGIDGRPLVGGWFTNIGGESKNRLARLPNDPATSELSAVGTEQVTWMRGGSSPEIERVSFDYWDGISWVGAGPVERIPGGWQATGLTLPTSTWLRASGVATSGMNNASTSRIEEIISYGGGAFPQIDVSVGGEMLVFGNAAAELEPTQWKETSAPLTLTIHNTGDAPLTGLSVSFLGNHAQEFSASGFPEDPLPPGGQVAFDVFFSPMGGGIRQTSLWIASNDGSRSPYVVRLEGLGLQYDDGFTPDPSSTVRAVATQADGRIVVGGQFTSLSGVSRSRIARIHPDGTVDAGFRAEVDSTVLTVAIQSNGKILLGGFFTSINGTARSRIARLNADGTLDLTFAPEASGTVNAIAVQADGSILVGGQFTTLSGQSRQRIARLHPDGSLDLSFDPGAGNTVNTIAVQTDGKILLGGFFTSIGGSVRQRIARLHPDGSLDTSFNPAANGTVNTIAVQPDGKILVGGAFFTIGGAARMRLARLNEDGTADGTFDSGSAAAIHTFALQTDGKILIGGEFSFIAGSARANIARLNADGTVDDTFDPGADGTVFAITLDANGSPLAGGSFTGIGGGAVPHLARLLNDPATSELSVGGSEEITWMRGVSAPEIERVSFDYWSGSSWIPAEPAERVPGGWQATDLALPASAWVRARGVVTGGVSNASTGWVEEILAYGAGDFPGLGVSAQDRALVAMGDTVDFGEIDWLGNDAVIPFTITNLGDAQLENLAISLGGPDAGMFAEEPLATTSLAPGESTTFDVVFSSMANGEVVATLSIASNAAGTGPFEVVLRGTVARTDLDFMPQADNSVFALAPQADGKVVVAGNFTAINGIPHERIARLHADGELDASFNAAADGWIYAVAIQADGKIVIGGNFTTVNGQPRIRIARLHADGSLDESFTPEVNHGAINAIAIQPDGKILLGGDFTRIGEEPRLRIARLHPGGTLDEDFDPGVNQGIRTLVLQDDGKILIGGFFTLVAGVNRQRIARLHPDGSLDEGFDPSVPGNWRVSALARQPDGKIVIAGQFILVGGVSRQNLARIHDDGTVDMTFDAPVNNWIDAVAIQADGKILLGGEFTAINGQLRSRVARLLADGSVDPTFNPGANGWINGIALQADGEILAVGTFTQISGQPRDRIARLRNEAAVPQLSVTDSGVIHWTPGGAMPVPTGVYVEYRDGDEWVGLGLAARVPTGWQLVTSPLPASGELRFICRTSGGRFCGSNGFVTVSQSYDGYSFPISFATWPVLAGLPPDRRGKLDTNGPLSMPNILAYAMALDPLTATAADMPVLAGASDFPGRMILRFRRGTAHSDVALAIEVSSDLAENSWMPAVWHGTTLVDAGADWEIIEVEIEAPHSERGFFRLRVDDLDP